jgi:para-nitrobenzyl esterase
MIASLLALALAASGPVVASGDGRVRGQATADGRALFRGIPFAAAPVGERRWRPPAAPARWPGVRDATRSAPACPQIDYGWNHDAAVRQSEDCLYLEVATPSLAPKRPLPVMVWIHGGGNRAGGGADAIDSPLVARGVVLVSIQYRLSALGFLSHPALGARSGNYALMDQQAALHWVRRNIARFGGNPANVTIFGGSAGGQDVGLQLLSPGAHGLFDRAIEQSGTPGFGLAPRTLAENERLGEAIATAAGAPPHADAAALRRLPAAALIRASEAADVPDLDDDSFIWLQAVVDGAVIVEPPAETLARGGGLAVPTIVGSNARELPLHGGAGAVDRTLDRAYGARSAEARALYAKEPAVDARLGDLATRLADDIVFRCPGIAVAADRARAGLPVWHYQFDVPGPDGKAVDHSSELPFAFDRVPADLQATAPIARYWVNFARTGDPNGAGLPAWPRYRTDERASLAFTPRGPTIERGVRDAACALRRVP